MDRTTVADNLAGPVVTDNANFILDWFWPREEERSAKDWDMINTQLQTMPGVLETGLFVNMAIKVLAMGYTVKWGKIDLGG
jgi:ribose 5-phosphate isomerase A